MTKRCRDWVRYGETFALGRVPQTRKYLSHYMTERFITAWYSWPKSGIHSCARWVFRVEMPISENKRVLFTYVYWNGPSDKFNILYIFHKTCSLVLFKSVWFSLLSDEVSWHESGSTLAQVIVCCLTAPGHYVNQCWLAKPRFCGNHI